MVVEAADTAPTPTYIMLIYDDIKDNDDDKDNDHFTFYDMFMPIKLSHARLYQIYTLDMYVWDRLIRRHRKDVT